MNVSDDFKKIIKNVSAKVPQATQDTWLKLKDTGEEGLEFSKDIIDEISVRVSDVGNLVKLKREISKETTLLNETYTELGKITFTFLKYSSGQGIASFDVAEALLDKASHIRQSIKVKTENYEEIKKEYAGSNHVINSFADELSKSGHMMDQTIIGDKSNVVGKKMREIQFPKQALITSVKRADKIIVPDGNTQFEAGDKVTIMGAEGDVQKVIKRLSAT